ncbi:MAG TPA: hypothetical protein EYP60_01975 [bacterium (Candidatus Stahlbacteria)]|nr:hypothetical protein [Candidatus Stahlbacteria bacterium]
MFPGCCAKWALALILFPLILNGKEILPPSNVKAFDTPNDAGGSITITWELSPDDSIISGYEIWRSESPDTGYAMIGYTGREIKEYRNGKKVKNKVKYYYKVRARMKEFGYSPFALASSPATASYQWFDLSKTNVLVAVVVFISLLLYFVSRAKRAGESLFVRKIPGLDALDEAVGRATEMGKPLLYVPGLGYIDEVGTIAAMNILNRVARKVAEYGTPLLVPNRDPVVMRVAEQVVKEGYAAAGRPDLYKEDSVFFLTPSQFGYAAAVDGIMVREKPATNIFMGLFYAESLILAETGNMTGAIQIAGTDRVLQLPFFITACDYTLMGEELYVASAYLSREPSLLGSIKAQDYTKLGLLLLIVIGTILGLMGIYWIVNLFEI